MDAEAATVEVGRQPPGAVTEIAVGEAPLTPDNRLPVGNGGRHLFLDDGEVELLCTHRIHLPLADRGGPAMSPLRFAPHAIGRGRMTS